MPNFRSKNTQHGARLARQFKAACNPPADKAGVTNLPDALTTREPYKVSAPAVKFEYLTEIDGLKIIMTDHAKRQAMKRHGMPLETMRAWFVNSSRALLHIRSNLVEYNQEVFVYNAKYQRGMILAFRRDFKNQDSNKICLAVITVYPYGKATPMHPDTEVFYA